MALSNMLMLFSLIFNRLVFFLKLIASLYLMFIVNIKQLSTLVVCFPNVRVDAHKHFSQIMNKQRGRSKSVRNNPEAKEYF